jgi:hypothetical protein
MRFAVMMVLLLVCGCGVSVSTSGVRVGLIDEVTVIENDSRLTTEELVGVKIDWAPKFTWRDIVDLFTKDEE